MNLEETCLYADCKIGEDPNEPGGGDLLWSLQAGTVEHLMQHHSKSNEYFDMSEKMLNHFDHQNEILDSAAAIAVNENVIPYTGEEYDGVMINPYKALNFMVLGNDSYARVEFNRALDRQRRAAEYFSGEINEAKQKDSKENTLAEKAMESPKFRNRISEHFPNLHNFQPYKDYVNPFTTYLAGIYFNLVGDHEKAIDLLKRTYEMVNDNQYIREDMVSTEAVLNGEKELDNQLWVIFFNGLGPYKKEVRIDLPLFIATDEVKYVGIALPKLEFRDQAYDYITVGDGSKEYKTQLVANMDRVVQAEFEKDFEGILTRAVLSATAKAVAQYALKKNSQGTTALLSWAAAAYSFVTTAADVRIWTTLPKNFQVARIDIPADRNITINIPGDFPYYFSVPKCNNALLTVRIPFKGADPVFNFMGY